jgi:N-acetylglutamate synthase-like GNAT family acetyltransferase
MLIRRTIESDIPMLSRIVSQNYSRQMAEHFSAEVLTAFMPYPFRPFFYSAVEGDALVGCAGYVANWLAYGTFSLSWVNVELTKQKAGIGRALVDQCLADLHAVAEHVILATTVPDFYSKNWGFKRLATFGGLSGADVLMSLDLQTGPLS